MNVDGSGVRRPVHSTLRFGAIAFIGGWLALSGVLWLHSTGRITLLWRVEAIQADRMGESQDAAGRVFTYHFSRAPGDTSARPALSRIILQENGRPLGPAHSEINEVRSAGHGAFIHLGRDLFFSTSDNSDPRTNGRSYEIRYVPWTQPRHQSRYLLLLLVGVGFSVVYVFRARILSATAAAPQTPQGVGLETSASSTLPQQRPMVSGGDARCSLMLLLALAMVAAFFFALLAPLTFELGFCGDDWNHIFTRMSDGGFWADLTASLRFFWVLQRPTPLQSVSLAALHSIFGADPSGYFLIGYIVMAANAVLIGYVVRKFTRSDLAAFGAAVAWLFIPIKDQALYHVSAGTGKWQGSTYITLSLFFYLLSVTRPASRRWGIASAVAYALALMCYEQAVAIFPAFLIIQWFCCSRRLLGRLVGGWFWLHVLLTGCYVVVRSVILDASSEGRYHIETAAGLLPWGWLRSGWESGEINWYLNQYRHAWDAISWHTFQKANTLCLCLVIVLAGGLLMRGRPRQYLLSANGSAAKRLLTYTGFVLAAVTVFVGPQALLLLLSTSPDGRMMVFPSVGLALLVGAAVGLLDHGIAALRLSPVVRCGEAALIALLAVGGACMGSKVLQGSVSYTEAGVITRSIHSQLRQLKSTVRDDQQVVILGTPWLMPNRTWVFTADYAVAGCVRSALDRPTLPDVPDGVHGRMTILPEENGYDGFLNIRSHPEMFASIHNYYTAVDRFLPEAPLRGYDRLALFVFDGHLLRRVNRLDFQDLSGSWRQQVLAAQPAGIEFRLPRIATLVESCDALPPAIDVHLRLDSIELCSVGLARVPELMDTFHVQLAWKKLRPDALRELARLQVFFLDAAGECLWWYSFPLDKNELARQLENHEWEDGRFLRQDFLVNENSGNCNGDSIDRVDRVRFLLRSFPPDGAPPSREAEGIYRVGHDVQFVQEQQR